MRRRSAVLLVVLVFGALVASAQARAAASTYSDLSGDGEYGSLVSPDIAGVRIELLSDGMLDIDVPIVNEPTQLARSEVNVFLNTDRSRVTGSGGYDFLIKVKGPDSTPRLDRWANGWTTVPAPSLRVAWSSGPSIDLSSLELGGVTSFDFLVQAGWENPRAIYSDFAPNERSWAFPSGSSAPLVTPPGPPPPPPDAKAPVTRILAGPSGTAKSAGASFRFASNEAKSTFECKLDRARWAVCKSPKAYRGLARGAHVFQVRATDYVGNVDRSPAVRRWRVG